MGKWASRLAENTAAHTCPGTATTDKRVLLSALAVTSEGGVSDSQVEQPRPLVSATDHIRSAEAWTGAEIAVFTDRYNRLLRWGWAKSEAEKLAERLATRDRGADDRVMCAAECLHYRPGRCGSHKAAGLSTAEVGRDMASVLQRCQGFGALTPPALR